MRVIQNDTARGANRMRHFKGGYGMAEDIITITVTADHIARGVKYSLWDCPILLAVREQVPEWGGGSPGCALQGLDDIKRFMRDFDEGREVFPAQFRFQKVPRDIAGMPSGPGGTRRWE